MNIDRLCAYAMLGLLIGTITGVLSHPIHPLTFAVTEVAIAATVLLAWIVLRRRRT